MDTPKDLHSFSKTNPERDSLRTSPRIRDPAADTAPLQGSGDRSDEDSVVDGYGKTESDSATDADMQTGATQPAGNAGSGQHR